MQINKEESVICPVHTAHYTVDVNTHPSLTQTKEASLLWGAYDPNSFFNFQCRLRRSVLQLAWVTTFKSPLGWVETSWLFISGQSLEKIEVSSKKNMCWCFRDFLLCKMKPFQKSFDLGNKQSCLKNKQGSGSWGPAWANHELMQSSTAALCQKGDNSTICLLLLEYIIIWGATSFLSVECPLSGQKITCCLQMVLALARISTIEEDEATRIRSYYTFLQRCLFHLHDIKWLTHQKQNRKLFY